MCFLNILIFKHSKFICVEHELFLFIFGIRMKTIFGLLGLLFGCVTICILFTGCGKAGEEGGLEGAWTYETAPSELPEDFTTGRHATAERIARWDIDIKPDGDGLPAGSGTSKAGEQVYAIKCAACHGLKGEGGVMGMAMRGPRLIGRVANDDFSGEGFREKQPKGPFGSPVLDILDENREKMRLFDSMTIGSYWPFSTTLYDYINRAMPQTMPGSLKPDEVYSLVAYLLYRNEIIEEDMVMDAQTLPQVKMPARDRFIPDDRLETNEVR